MRKIVLPLAVLLLSAGSAYSTSAVKKQFSENGYRFDPIAPLEKCIMTENHVSRKLLRKYGQQL